MPTASKKLKALPLLVSLVLIPVGLSACTAVARSGDYIVEADVASCDEFLLLANPYDGSNESLWDSESMDSYQQDVEYAGQYAEETDLLDYFRYLDSAIADAITGQTNGSSKSEVESSMSEVETASSDLAAHCDWILSQ